ncbi:GATA-type zinc finger protein 1-like [Oncorhynchus keta]|uniref:GATA-type zinc finger protein 1-like n=1 Tax=Oncorhynchus keta TaxID=8018 RepID=UPI00227BFB57|nr:GATA-type zinc finger protein 1-like [Oncorhynchus keta]
MLTSRPRRAEPNMTLDFNSNICFTFDPKEDMPPAPNSSYNMLLILNSEAGSVNVNEKSVQDGSIAGVKAELNESSMEEDTDTVQDTSIITDSPLDLTQRCKDLEDDMDTIPAAPSLPLRLSPCGGPPRPPGSSSVPSRSVDVGDPDFQGVTFRMQTELDDSREQCRLLITSKKYSEELSSGPTRRSLRAGRSRSSQSSMRTSSSEESDPSSKNKICASCCTMKTPLWRDAEDGTPLCNACGIRYKKYKVRCLQCWHIPRKEGNSNSRCFKCGNLSRLATSHRKHSAL